MTEIRASFQRRTITVAVGHENIRGKGRRPKEKEKREKRRFGPVIGLSIFGSLKQTFGLPIEVLKFKI